MHANFNCESKDSSLFRNQHISNVNNFTPLEKIDKGLKRFPGMRYGSNIESPTYMRISNLKENELSISCNNNQRLLKYKFEHGQDNKDYRDNLKRIGPDAVVPDKQVFTKLNNMIEKPRKILTNQLDRIEIYHKVNKSSNIGGNSNYKKSRENKRYGYEGNDNNINTNIHNNNTSQKYNEHNKTTNGKNNINNINNLNIPNADPNVYLSHHNILQPDNNNFNNNQYNKINHSKQQQHLNEIGNPNSNEIVEKQIFQKDFLPKITPGVKPDYSGYLKNFHEYDFKEGQDIDINRSVNFITKPKIIYNCVTNKYKKINGDCYLQEKWPLFYEK